MSEDDDILALQISSSHKGYYNVEIPYPTDKTNLSHKSYVKCDNLMIFDKKHFQDRILLLGELNAKRLSDIDIMFDKADADDRIQINKYK